MWLPLQGLIGSEMQSFLLAAEQEAISLVPPIDMRIETGVLTWFDDPEMRFAASDEEEQSYGLRVRPRLSGERSVERAIYELEIQRRSGVYESVLNDFLKTRYMVLIDMLSQQIEIDNLDQKADLLRETITIHQNLVQTTVFDPEELEALELEYLQLEREKKLNMTRLQFFSRSNDLYGDEMATLLATRSDWLLPISDLTDHLTEGTDRSGEVESNLRVQTTYTDLRLAQEILKLARKKNRSFLNFLELRYTEKQNNKSELTFSLAISLGRRKSGLFKREVDVGNAQMMLLKRRLDTERLLAKARSTLRSLVDEAQAIQDTITNIDQRVSRRQIGGNARLVLQLKQERLAQQQGLWKIRLQAVRFYIDYLHISGQLVSPPLRNWLRKGQPLLKDDTG